MSARLHENEFHIDESLVEKLIARACPVFASLPIERLQSSGSSNVLYRLGADLLVRLPRQPGGGAGIMKENSWLPHLRGALNVQVPEIVGTFAGTHDYPECWSIVRWLDGNHPQHQSNDSLLAHGLANVLLELRAAPVPDRARADPALREYRGRALSVLDPAMQRNIAVCETLPGLDLDFGAIRTLWREALSIPAAAESTWFHGDLVAENLLLVSGMLTGVLDFGGLGIGDPSIDLHGAWELFDEDARHSFRTRLGIDDHEWLRGRAWALAVAMMTLTYYGQSMPERAASRLSMVRAILDEAG